MDLHLHHVAGIRVGVVNDKCGDARIRNRVLENDVAAHVAAPQTEMLGIDIVARGECPDRGLQLGGFPIPERGHSCACPMRCEIEKKHVELLILQRGN